MKRRHAGILIAMFLFLSCFSKKITQINGPVIATTAIDSTIVLEMIGSLDCIVCHRMEEKLLGPAFRDVSLRYEATEVNIQKLVNKIKTGGSGTWGSVPMTPHPNLGPDSLRVIVKYILSLKTRKN